MQNFLQRWEELCASSPILRFVDVNLRGVGQVMFQDNALTGLLFLLAIAWGAFAAGAPQVFFAGLIAVVVATATAMWLKVDRSQLNAGLYGYNGVLVGLAVSTFIAPTPLLWAYVVLGAIVSVIATLGTANALKPMGIAALTFPFVLVTWLLLLASYGFAGLTGAGLPAASVVAPFKPAAALSLGLGEYITGVLLSISQVFLKASVVSALLFVAGLAVNSVPAAVFAIAGAVLAVVTAHCFGAESDLVTGGLLGFSPVLTSVALGTVFHSPTPRVALYAACGTIFTVVAQAALNAALSPIAIPALTAPFVLVTWMFMLPRASFDDAAT
jgi:urea transporter